MKKRNGTQSGKRPIAFRLLYYWGKFLGLNPLTLSSNNKFELSQLSLIYACSLCTIYCYIFYLALDARRRQHLLGETPIALISNTIGVCCQFLKISLTWLLFATRQRTIVRLVKSLAKIEKMTTDLRIPNDYDDNLRTFGIYVAINNTVYVLSCVFTSMMLSHYPDYNSYRWTLFNVPEIVSFNMGILFVWILVIVKKKFRRLNERMRFLVINNCPKIEENDEQSSRGSIRNPSRNFVVISDRIFVVSALHRELRDLIRGVLEHFGPLIYFTVGHYLGAFISTTYVTYQRLKDFRSLTGATIVHQIGSSSHWFLYATIVFVVLATVCGSTSQEANNTANILHGILCDFENIKDPREFAEFNVLSLDLLRNRVSISVFGLFELNNYFLYRNVATAITYFAIMLQFYN